MSISEQLLTFGGLGEDTFNLVDSFFFLTEAKPPTGLHDRVHSYIPAAVSQAMALAKVSRCVGVLRDVMLQYSHPSIEAVTKCTFVFQMGTRGSSLSWNAPGRSGRIMHQPFVDSFTLSWNTATKRCAKLSNYSSNG